MAFVTAVPPLSGERWWGGVINDESSQPYGSTVRPLDLTYENKGGATSAFLVSTRGRYVWSDRPFAYAFTNGALTVTSESEKVEPVVAGTTLKEAYLTASRRHFPFDGRIPAELLFTKPQWNNWIEIAIQGMNQKSVDAYTEALAASGFPCGVYMMDGGWFSHMGSYRFHAEDFPDPKGMFARIRSKGWKSMIWTAHFVSPDSREAKVLRRGLGYRIVGKDLLAYKKEPNAHHMTGAGTVGVVWWWSGVSAVWDLTYPPAWDDYAATLGRFAAEYGIDGFKFDAGDPARLEDNLRFHDPSKRGVDYAHDYVRVGAEKFPYNEYRCGFNTGGMPVMQRLHDQAHSWEALRTINAKMLAGGLVGSPYLVADMVGGGLAGTYRPGSFFSGKSQRSIPKRATSLDAIVSCGRDLSCGRDVLVAYYKGQIPILTVRDEDVASTSGAYYKDSSLSIQYATENQNTNHANLANPREATQIHSRNSHYSRRFAF